ncbi:MAG: type I-E CRISPR-associated protein Cas6/Cse3/CasE [Nannocystaceae bacterium]
MASDPLYLLRLDVEAPRLYSLAKRHRLPPKGNDLGYVLHAGLAALFGDQRPESFAIDRAEGRWIRLLAYSEQPLAALRERAELYADPEVYRLCDWDRAADKSMPSVWREGQRLGFQVRVCPTVRMARAGEHHKKGAEVDVFLATARQEPEGPRPDREVVYRKWLGAALDRSGGARLEVARIENFHLEALLRRTQGEERRARRGLRKPDAMMRGALTITTPERFEALLRRGVGRHRAFGFGMLLLRPDRGDGC